MTTLAVTYQLPVRIPLLTHGRKYVRLVRDGVHERRLETDAKVRSGDYMIDLATELDRISQAIDDPADKILLQRRVSELLYLQLKYKFEKR